MTRTHCQPTIEVAIVGFDQCMTSAVTGLCDAFLIANLWAARAFERSAVFAPRVVSANGRPVQGSCGFYLPAGAPLARAKRADLILIPPIFADCGETVRDNPRLVAWLRSHPGIIASVCTGAFFLAEAGLLSRRCATTNPLFADAFSKQYPDVKLALAERLVDEGRVLSAGSTTSFLDLAIYLIDRLAGHELAVLTAKSLALDMTHRSQLPYFVHIAPKDHGDDAVLRLQTWLEKHHARAIGIAELARRAAMSQRTLHRRFAGATGMSPVDYLHRLRVESAKRLLEASRFTLDEITSQVGYEDPRSFSRLFKVQTGLTPRAYRARFGSTPSSR